MSTFDFSSISKPCEVNLFPSPFPEHDARHPDFNKRVAEQFERMKQDEAKVIAEQLEAERSADEEEAESPKPHLWSLPTGLMGTVAEFCYWLKPLAAKKARPGELEC